jgi:hypothetical protein
MAGLFEDRKSGFHYKCTRAPSIPRGKESWELPVLFLEVTLFILKPFIGPLHLLVFQELAQKTQCCTVLSLDFIVKNNLHSRVVSNIGNIELTVGLL